MTTAILDRADLRQIARIIEPESRVLDVGSGDGRLLAYLKEQKGVDGRGIELRQNRVNVSLGKGLAVIQGDAEEELPEYPSNSFDYVVLSRTLPAAKNPKEMLRQMLRIGRRGVLSMANFGYWRVRMHLLFRGTMPVTKSLDNPWYDTENIHLCTMRDFMKLAKEMDIIVEKCVAITNNKVLRCDEDDFYTNFFAEEVVFVIKKKDD